MPARSWSKGTDHAAQYPRRPYDNQYHRFCSICSAHTLQAKGRKYWTCLTCGTRTERDSLAAASPPNGARDHSEARLDESKDETLCIKCGKRKRYEHRGRVFALCAVCGWNNIKEFLDLPDTAAELRNEAEAGEHTCPLCGGSGRDPNDPDPSSCPKCYGSGQV